MILKIFFITILLLIIWSAGVEPNIITVNKVQINDEQLRGTKIIFASDLHIKPYESFRLKRIVNIINKQNADIVLLGGDYVNGHRKGNSMPIQDIAQELAKLQSKYGTYAVIGNHDGWQGKEEAIKTFKDNNINVLVNENKMAGKIFIAGVDDMQTGNPDIYQALNDVKGPVILLSHTPDIFPKVPDTVNLTLAGHLHCGQIRFPGIGPVILPSKYGKRYAEGLIIENGKKMFASLGLGCSILPIRFNCPPEIVVIEFT